MYHTLLAFALASAAAARAATVCPIVDANFNLYVFGGAQDITLGAQSGWATATATPITASGRPPFNGNNLRCHLNEFDNVILILGADTANKDAVHIFDPTAKAWSVQAVNNAGLDTTSIVEILDHDTVDFYTLSGGDMWFLSGLSGVKTATSSPLTWVQSNAVSFTTSGYSPTMAIADNHIYFFGVPGAPADALFIYVIHFAFSQPDAQTYPGATLPAQHGAAPSLFNTASVQKLIAYVPDDASGVFLVDVLKNSTAALPGPTDKSAGALYVASDAALVQLTSAGKLAFLAIDPNAESATGGWTSMAATVDLAAPGTTTSSSGSAGAGGSSTSAGASGSAGASASGTTSGGAPTNTPGAAPRQAAAGVLGAAVALGVAALL